MPNELAPEFLDADWGAWDIDDAYLIIEDALEYILEHDSP